MDEIERWCTEFGRSLQANEFVKLTLSKPVGGIDLMNVYVKPVIIKRAPQLSFTYHHKTRDVIKNIEFQGGIDLVRSMLGSEFKIGTLLTTTSDFVLRISKKGKMDIKRTDPTLTSVPPTDHDEIKVKRASSDDAYLFHLGITDKDGNVIPRMADKYRQINKYLEVMESLIRETELPSKVSIVDMGAGKGYLTFALYDYLNNKVGHKASIVGVEIRKELVKKGNELARLCGFNRLRFECSSIEEFNPSHVDILIALHACDTATDDSIAKGIGANAALIVCAPCCHKQIRQQLKGKEHTNPILKYGIFKEREFEMVTDTLRALIMERHGYKPGIFEFISNEHTRKNVMLVGTRTKRESNAGESEKKIDLLKRQYQIDFHYLEKLMDT